MKQMNIAILCLLMAQCAGISASWSLRNDDGSINLAELTKRENARERRKKLAKEANITAKHLTKDESETEFNESMTRYKNSASYLMHEEMRLTNLVQSNPQNVFDTKNLLDNIDRKKRIRQQELNKELKSLSVAAIFPYSEARQKYINAAIEIQILQKDPQAHIVWPTLLDLNAKFAALCAGSTLLVGTILVKSSQK